MVRGLFIAVLGLLSSCGAQALEHMGSVVAVRGLVAPRHVGS